MSLNDKKKLLIIEDTIEINNAINDLKNETIIIDRIPIVEENWFDNFKSELLSFNHKLIEKYNIQLDPKNILLKSFYAIYKGYYDGFIIGHQYSSKIVFIYSIIFFGSNPLSTCFVCEIKNRLTVWSDCALNINPGLDLMKIIIENSANFYYHNVNQKSSINVHLLSFSTFEDSNDESIRIYQKLINDTKWKDYKKYKINLVGPIQFDASINEDIYYKKTNLKNYQSPDIFIFPNLNAANIAYKIQSQFAKFYGPFICGSNKKIADLSRSATLEEIKNTILIMCNKFMPN